MKAKCLNQGKCGVGMNKSKVCLWMNALLESKLLNPRKTIIYWQPNLITILESPLDSFCVFSDLWYEMKCIVWDLC